MCMASRLQGEPRSCDTKVDKRKEKREKGRGEERGEERDRLFWALVQSAVRTASLQRTVAKKQTLPLHLGMAKRIHTSHTHSRQSEQTRILTCYLGCVSVSSSFWSLACGCQPPKAPLTRPGVRGRAGPLHHSTPLSDDPNPDPLITRQPTQLPRIQVISLPNGGLRGLGSDLGSNISNSYYLSDFLSTMCLSVSCHFRSWYFLILLSNSRRND